MHVPLTDLQPYPLLLYVGPDQILPLTSALAAITGFLLLLWNQIKALGQRAAQWFTNRKAGTRTDQEGR